MEQEDQLPEEIPMDEVLAEIRHMLTQGEETVRSPAPAKNPTPTVSEESEPDIFVLTPAMRCDSLWQTPIRQVRQQADRVLEKLQNQQDGTPLSPALEAWLNQNLPRMIERILEKRLS